LERGIRAQIAAFWSISNRSSCPLGFRSALGKLRAPDFGIFCNQKKKVWKIQWEQKDFPEKAEFEGLDYSWFGEPNN